MNSVAVINGDRAWPSAVAGDAIQSRREHVLVEREVGHQPFQPAVFVLERSSFRSSLTPSWAYFFFQR